MQKSIACLLQAKAGAYHKLRRSYSGLHGCRGSIRPYSGYTLLTNEKASSMTQTWHGVQKVWILPFEPTYFGTMSSILDIWYINIIITSWVFCNIDVEHISCALLKDIQGTSKSCCVHTSSFSFSVILGWICHSKHSEIA